MGNQGTRRLGSLCRIYKNSAGKIISIDEVEVVVDSIYIKNQGFFRSVNSINVKTHLLFLETGGDRVISTIQVIGDFSTIEENAGNFYILTWLKSSSGENDVVVSLEDKVSKIGDTV